MTLKLTDEHMYITSITERQRFTWSIDEISKATGLSANFLRYEIRRGNLAVRKFGRRVLVRNDDLESYLETGSNGNKELAVDE